MKEAINVKSARSRLNTSCHLSLLQVADWFCYQCRHVRQQYEELEAQLAGAVIPEDEVDSATGNEALSMAVAFVGRQSQGSPIWLFGESNQNSLITSQGKLFSRGKKFSVRLLNLSVGLCLKIWRWIIILYRWNLHNKPCWYHGTIEDGTRYPETKIASLCRPHLGRGTHPTWGVGKMGVNYSHAQWLAQSFPCCRAATTRWRVDPRGNRFWS